MKKINTIALVAPSGKLKNLDEINKKISILEKRFKIKKYYDENASYFYLSDSDENRARYFESAFLDDEVDLVLSVRGGYGAIRMVDKINYDLIKKTSKYYVASSDGTILLGSLFKNTKIKTFHGLMVSNGFVENLDKNIEIIENDIFDIDLKPIKEGRLKGVLWGGNLSSLVSLFSDEQFIPNDDIVLFLEDLAEPLYKIDKMFYEIYRNQKLKSKIKGIIFGDFYLDSNDFMSILEQYSDLFNVACYVSYDITHKINNTTIPFGKYIDL